MRRMALSVMSHAVAVSALWFGDAFTKAELPSVAASDKVWEATVLVAPAPPPHGSPVRPVRPRRTASAPATQPTLPVAEPAELPSPEDVLGNDPPGASALGETCVEAACGLVGAGRVGVDVAGTPATREPPRIVRVSDVRPPRKVRDVAPVYPETARMARVQGRVVVECVIDPSGRVTNARVMSGPQLLQRAALEAMEQWQYTPTLLSGVPVSVLMSVSVDFRLR